MAEPFSIYNLLMEAIKPLLTSEFLSALIGALVGGLFTLRAAKRAHALEFEARTNAEVDLLHDTTRLVQVEITTAFNIYMEEYGKDLLELSEGHPYTFVFPIGESPFPIYDSSPACLSRLDPELSSLIVRIYMRAKGLVTMIEMNNRDTERAQHLADETLKESLARAYDEQNAILFNELADEYPIQVRKNALLIGMPSTADGMKEVTMEVAELLTQINTKIDALPKEQHKQRK